MLLINIRSPSNCFTHPLAACRVVAEDGTHILVRHCSDANWGSHCGDIRYLDHSMEERIIGCLESCDFDGCNSAPPTRPSSLFLCLLSLALTFLLHLSL